jgi:hypothetical protein
METEGDRNAGLSENGRPIPSLGAPAKSGVDADGRDHLSNMLLEWQPSVRVDELSHGG